MEYKGSRVVSDDQSLGLALFHNISKAWNGTRFPNLILWCLVEGDSNASSSLRLTQLSIDVIML